MKKQLLQKIKDEKNHKKFIIWFLIFISIFSLGLVKKTFQNDTFYTIKIGELIFNNGIDMLDHFSFHPDLAYTYPHWLYDCFIYLVYYLGGYHAIYLSTIILYILLIFLIFKTNHKLTNNASISALSTFIGTLALGGFATARAQLATYIIFILEILFIESYLQNGKKKYLFSLLFLSLIICNIHVAVWPFYFIVYLPFLAEYLVVIICNKIKLKKDNKLINFFKNRIILDKNSRIKTLFLIMLLSLITGLFTPIGDTPYTYLIKTMLGNSQSYINEHQMMTWLDSPFTIIIVIEMIFLTIISKVKLRDLFLVSGLALMSIVSIRHISLLALLGTVCFCRTFYMFFETYQLPSDTTIIPFILKKKVKITSYILVIIFAICTLSLQNQNTFINSELYPTNATKYIKENLDLQTIRLYNDYNFGSYLILEDIPVFIDSRADLYTKQFSGLNYDIFDDYYYMANHYQQKFAEYQITHALLSKENNEMHNRLQKDNNYHSIYEDEYFILYERKISE